jgi:hypothetical protein
VRTATSGLGKVRAVFGTNTRYRGHRNTSSFFNLVSRISFSKKIDDMVALGNGDSVHGGMMGWGELGLMYKSIYTIYK